MKDGSDFDFNVVCIQTVGLSSKKGIFFST